MHTPPLWDGVLRRLAQEVPAFALEAWLSPLAATVGDDELRLVCPTSFHRDRIRERFLARVESFAAAEAGRPLRIRLDVEEAKADAPKTPDGSRKRTVPAGRSRDRRSPAAARAMRVEGPAGRMSALSQTQLAYSFDTFVVGPCNALAREASIAFADGRQLGASTLYLAGESGTGKTHLARSVADLARKNGQRRTLFTSAETFTTEFLAAIRSQRTAGFKRRFREECDLLVIDDVQFLRGKKVTQLELFHTVDYLVESGRRVVLTGDRLPRDIPDLDPRLRSRLTGGLVAEIEIPDGDARRDILRAKAAAGGVRLPADCLELLVESVHGSVRDLEGVLIQLVASASLLNRTIDLTLTEAALRKLLPRAAAPCDLMPETVIEIVAAFFQTTPAALASRSRRRDVLVPRQLAMYLCRRYGDASLQRIGEAVGRDHPAVSNAIEVVERRILERAPLRYQVEALCARLDERAGRRGRAEI